MKKQYRHFGFKAPEIKSDHYVFGAEQVPKVILRPDGQWLDFLPAGEKQFNDYFDTYGCTVFSTLNILEILLRFQQRASDRSDRFTYVSSETAPPGNDPHVVAESIRQAGTIDESELPFSPEITTLAQFDDLGANGATLVDEGLGWVKINDFLHEWVFSNTATLAEKQASMIECLKYSPLGGSVEGWNLGPDGLYFKQPGAPDNHWTAVVGYELGKKWFVFDTYPEDGVYLKELEWDYDFGYSKRYYLNLKPVTPVPVKFNLWQLIIRLLNAIFKR